MKIEWYKIKDSNPPEFTAAIGGYKLYIWAGAITQNGCLSITLLSGEPLGSHDLHEIDIEKRKEKSKDMFLHFLKERKATLQNIIEELENE